MLFPLLEADPAEIILALQGQVLDKNGDADTFILSTVTRQNPVMKKTMCLNLSVHLRATVTPTLCLFRTK